MVAAALSDAGIESYTRRGVAGGLQLTMLDGGFTPGQDLLLFVPALARARADEVVASVRPPELPELAPDDPLEVVPTTPVRAGGARRAVAGAIVALVVAPVAIAILALGAWILLAIFR